MTCRAGVILPLSRENKVITHLADRFHLGGSTSVRGFLHDGIGPKDDGKTVPILNLNQNQIKGTLSAAICTTLSDYPDFSL